MEVRSTYVNLKAIREVTGIKIKQNQCDTTRHLEPM